MIFFLNVWRPNKLTLEEHWLAEHACTHSKVFSTYIRVALCLLQFRMQKQSWRSGWPRVKGQIIVLLYNLHNDFIPWLLSGTRQVMLPRSSWKKGISLFDKHICIKCGDYPHSLVLSTEGRERMGTGSTTITRNTPSLKIQNTLYFNIAKSPTI